MGSDLTVFTIGHSTRTVEQFAGLLHANGVTGVVDVRTVPRSRHTPQFNADALPASLVPYGISYQHLPSLGGLRHASAESTNTGWHNASFRGYADYMQSAQFAAGIDDLLPIVAQGPTAIMCAEAVPWRCHRSMIGDALIVRGVRVLDIIGTGPPHEETLTSFAQADGTHISYPEPAADSEARP